MRGPPRAGFCFLPQLWRRLSQPRATTLGGTGASGLGTPRGGGGARGRSDGLRMRHWEGARAAQSLPALRQGISRRRKRGQGSEARCPGWELAGLAHPARPQSGPRGGSVETLPSLSASLCLPVLEAATSSLLAAPWPQAHMTERPCWPGGVGAGEGEGGPTAS